MIRGFLAASSQGSPLEIGPSANGPVDHFREEPGGAVAKMLEECANAHPHKTPLCK